ncbi:MAG: efflux RND transporter periplasmic adaptor subunit [Bacteroidota bacterium]|jgi:HlyD family secretion protein
MDRKIEKKKWTPKKIMYSAATAAFAIFVIYLIFFADKSAKLNVEKERITISTVRYGPFQEFIPVIGMVQPIRTFFLDVTEGGNVMKKFLEEGAFVKVGDPIVKFDNPELRLSIIYNEANVFQQINALRSTRLSFEQSKLALQSQLLDAEYKLLNQTRVHEVNKALYAKGLIPDNDFKASEDQYNLLVGMKELAMKSYEQDSIFRKEEIAQLERSVEQLQSNLKITQQQLEGLTVRAPIKGQLTSLKAEVGKSVSRGVNLGQIDDIDSFKVRVEIDEHYIDRVNARQMGGFSFSDRDYLCRIKTVYPEVTSGKFYVDMLFQGKMPDGIRRGQTLHINLNLSEQKQALVVDRGGFYQKTGGQWIFVVDPPGTFAVKRLIRLGLQNAQVFEVLEGLKEGEQVVTSSYDNYGDVDKLILK